MNILEKVKYDIMISRSWKKRQKLLNRAISGEEASDNKDTLNKVINTAKTIIWKIIDSHQAIMAEYYPSTETYEENYDYHEYTKDEDITKCESEDDYEEDFDTYDDDDYDENDSDEVDNYLVINGVKYRLVKEDDTEE